VAVVEVDRETGEVRFLKYVAVHDCGRIINPKLVEGQMYGGIAQGIGQALAEGMVYTAEGQPLTGSLLDYAVPKALGLPDLILETMETPSPTNPLGVKGIGELPTVAAPVAIANAILDALSQLGVRHIDTPLTTEKIWRALHGAVGA
jgi:carbon-monoxide dehydrogenase large subunit